MQLAGDGSVPGRDEELGRIGGFLAASGEGFRCLVIEGEAGIGKSTLFQWGVDGAVAAGYRVLVCRASGVEAALSYAALGDLLAHVFGEVSAELPLPQRRPLEIALLLERAHGAQPDERAIGVGVLGVLRAAAATGPVLVAIDDVQWLDGSSTAALEFAFRRLDGEQVAVLAARRLGIAGGLALPDAERLVVGPLSLGATHRMLMTRLGTSFPRPVLGRLHTNAGGNPFYALELGRALARREHNPGAAEPAPVPEDLAGLVRERLSQLPAEARTAPAAVAALAIPTIETVVRVCEGEREPLEVAIDAGILELDSERIRFSHPLLAAGAYEALWPPDRRALHRRLAGVVTDSEERARHLALGAEGPDRDVASAVDEAIQFAGLRGAQGAAAELAELAIRSTPATDLTDLRRRQLLAAELHLRTGNVAAARPLLDVLVLDATGDEHPRALFLLAQISSDDPATMIEISEQALEATGDEHLRAEIELERVMPLHAIGGLQTARSGALSAVRTARRAGDPVLLAFAVAVNSMLDVLAGEAVDLEALREAVRVEEDEVVWPLTEYPPSVVLGLCLQFADQLDEARSVLEASVARAGGRGDEFARVAALFHLAETECRAGRYERAAELAEEGLATVEGREDEQGRCSLLYVKALAATYRGRVDEARSAAEAGATIADRIGERPFGCQHRGGLGFLELSLGDAVAADTLLRPLWPEIASMGYGDPSVFPVLPNAIEAMIHVGDYDEAKLQLAKLERLGQGLNSAWCLSQAGRCRGAIAAAEGDIETAEGHFERALAEHDRLPGQFERGRTLLALGAARRRAKHRNAARAALNEAVGIFDELGTPLWANQVRAELASIGGRAPSSGELTATERRVAELVAEGQSTKQVAAALVVSPKTIEGHLSRIYAKLGIRSRVQLARRLSSDDPR